MTKSDTSKYNYRLILKYVSTIFSWTLFALLSIIGCLLIYYFIATKLYATKGDKYEPFFSIYTIVSGSMEPTINVYDVIINTKVDKEKGIRINDVITFTSTSANTSGMTVTHRVIGIKTLDDGLPCYVTRGDNNSNQDSSCVASKNVIGKVSAVIPGLGRIQFFLASKFGWLLIIVIPALYIIVKDVFKIFKVARDNKKEYGIEKTKVLELPKFESDIIPYEEYINEEEDIKKQSDIEVKEEKEVELPVKKDKKINIFKKKDKKDLSLTAMIPKLKIDEEKVEISKPLERNEFEMPVFKKEEETVEQESENSKLKVPEIDFENDDDDNIELPVLK